MSLSTGVSAGAAARDLKLPAPVWVAGGIVFASMMAAVLALANGDVRAFALSVVSGALLGVFVPVGVPFVYVLLTVTIPVQILVEEVTGIPYLGGSQWGLTKLHPATLVILVAAFGYRFAHRRQWQATRRMHASLAYIRRGMWLFVASVLVLSVVRLHPGGVIQVIENYLGPLILFLMVLAEYHGRPRRVAALTTFVVLVLTAVGVYGIAEYVSRYNMLYGPSYALSPLATQWYGEASNPEIYRITTTLGAPLVNAQYFLLAVTLAAGLLAGRSGFGRVVTGTTLPILVLATIATGARSAVLLLPTVPLCVLLLQRRVRALAWAVLLCGIVLLAVSYSPLSAVLKQRFTTSAGEASTLVRLRSLEFIPDVLRSTNPLIGNKLGRSGEVSKELFAVDAPIGFENPWLMLLSDVGLPLALLYVAIVARLLLAALGAGWRTRAAAVIYPAVGALVMVLMYSGYNSFGSKNTVNYLLWFSAALALSAASATHGSLAIGPGHCAHEGLAG